MRRFLTAYSAIEKLSLGSLSLAKLMKRLIYLRGAKITFRWLSKLAQAEKLEPPTKRFTAACSTD